MWYMLLHVGRCTIPLLLFPCSKRKLGNGPTKTMRMQYYWKDLAIVSRLVTVIDVPGLRWYRK